MNADRIPLDGGRASAFDEGFDKRRNYIHAEAIDLLIDGGSRVPLPGCPQCGAPAESYTWSTYDQGPGGVLLIDVGPCAHLFRTEPVPDRFQ